MEASEVLVIILASALALFLILAIALIVLLIKVVKEIRKITRSAGHAVRGAETIVTNLQKAVAPAVISRFFLEQVQRFTDSKKQSTKERKD